MNRLSLALVLTTALFHGRVSAKDDCVPWTWRWNAARLHEVPATATVTAEPAPSTYVTPYAYKATSVEPGGVVCRSWAQTYDNVGYWSCQELADKFGIALDKFWVLNPELAPDCKGVKPNTEYCVAGFIEPLRSTDGFCGPNHKNATCIGTDFGQCCNAGTWKCGQTTDDCAPGICWEGQCPGHTIYSTDGKCGYQHGYTLCAGKWGDCCSLADGKCGTGEKFCGATTCQSGNCTEKAVTGGGTTT